MMVRNDTGVYEGGESSLYYDLLLAKLVTHAPTRPEAAATRAMIWYRRGSPVIPYGREPSTVGQSGCRCERRSMASMFRIAGSRPALTSTPNEKPRLRG